MIPCEITRFARRFLSVISCLGDFELAAGYAPRSELALVLGAKASLWRNECLLLGAQHAGFQDLWIASIINLMSPRSIAMCKGSSFSEPSQVS